MHNSKGSKRRRARVNTRHSIEYGIAKLCSMKRFLTGPDFEEQHRALDALILRLLEDRDVAYKSKERNTNV